MQQKTFIEAGHYEEELFNTQTIQVVYENKDPFHPYVPLQSDNYYDRSTGSYRCPDHALDYTIALTSFYANFETYLERHLGYSRHPVSGRYGYWQAT